jgi:hypothetical protein
MYVWQAWALARQHLEQEQTEPKKNDVKSEDKVVEASPPPAPENQQPPASVSAGAGSATVTTASSTTTKVSDEWARDDVVPAETMLVEQVPTILVW